MFRRWTKSKNQSQLNVFFSKLQLVCIWVPTTRREVCPSLLQSMLIKILNTKQWLKNVVLVLCSSKYPIFLSPQKSNKSLLRAPKWYQHKDQLSLGYYTGVWTADKVNFPCVEQLGSECSPEMQWWKDKKKIFRAERSISSLSTPLTNSAEQNSSWTVLWFSTSVKFFRVIFDPLRLFGAKTWKWEFYLYRLF